MSNALWIGSKQRIVQSQLGPAERAREREGARCTCYSFVRFFFSSFSWPGAFDSCARSFTSRASLESAVVNIHVHWITRTHIHTQKNVVEGNSTRKNEKKKRRSEE